MRYINRIDPSADVAGIARIIAGLEADLPKLRKGARLKAEAKISDLLASLAAVERAAAEYRHHAEGEDAPRPRAVSDSFLTRDSSWVVIRKADGAIIMETFSPVVRDAINREAYRVVPIMEHLQSINAAIRAQD